MRVVKWLGVAILLAIAVFALVRYTAEPNSRPENLTIALDSELERLDPLTIKNPKTFIVSWQVFEGLLGLDAEGNLVPKLASEWTSNDNKTWRFTIREGVSFHDSPLFGADGKGRAVTAEDVVASYTAFCGANAYPAFLLTDILEGCADFNAGKANTISGIRKTGPMTVELVLSRPEPYFLRRLSTAWIAIFPKEALQQANKDQWGLSTVVGTGPFKMVSNSETEVRLTRNPNYWDNTSTATVKAIAFRVIKNDQARLDAIRNGSVDLMPLPPALFPSALNVDGTLKKELAAQLTLNRYGTFNSHMIGFNVTKIPDANLRRAISLGIDRKALIDSLFYGHAQINGGTVPLIMKGYKSDIPADSLYNPTQAKAELAQSNYRGEELELLVHDQASSEQIGQLVQSQLKPIGINIRITKVDFSTAISRMVQGDAPMFSMYFDYVFSTPELVLSNLFASEKRPVPNFWQYSNPAIDKELGILRTEPAEQSLRHSAEIEAAVVRDAPAAFLFQLNSALLERKGLAPVSVNAHGHFDFASMGD